MKQAAVFSPILILLFLGGCTVVPTPLERQKTLTALSSEQNLTIQPIYTERFDLTSIVSGQCEDKSMRVYIEGDGFAWATRSRLSDNPTPINPLSAKLMAIDNSKCKAYLARPCQYEQSKECNQRYWSSARFSPEVIESYNEALDQLKKQYKIASFTLIGYSGGGAVAALEATQREDVKQLITIAGNLDSDAWTSLQGLEPLSGSLNPADASKRLQNIPQIHFTGSKDTVIPKEIFESYKNHFSDSARIKHIECNECTHNNGWDRYWFMNQENLQR